MGRLRILPLCGAALLLFFVSSASSETGWVRGEIRLNVRTGPGKQYRIVGLAKTGDRVTVLERTENWTQVGLEDQKGERLNGWVPAGYLEPQPPAAHRLEQAEAESLRLKGDFSALREEKDRLAKENQVLAGQEEEQQIAITELTRDNTKLRAGARYPEWIVGAAIFVIGMLVGAVARGNTSRRQSTRIRL